MLRQPDVVASVMEQMSVRTVRVMEATSFSETSVTSLNAVAKQKTEMYGLMNLALFYFRYDM